MEIHKPKFIRDLEREKFPSFKENSEKAFPKFEYSEGEPKGHKEDEGFIGVYRRLKEGYPV